MIFHHQISLINVFKKLILKKPNLQCIAKMIAFGDDFGKISQII